MIYLTTGANGAGKTLLTLRDVREKSIAENRPVYHNGRFEIAPDSPLKDWKTIEFKDWQSAPDGSIFVMDECHNEIPVRTGKDVPDFVRMLAEHRRRGFDFYLITQHPNNIDAFVRRLIGAPGWHRHLKRASGAPLVSVLTWASTNSNCEKHGSGESASVAMVPYPKEVYNWYVSTSLDTAKVKVPFQLKVLVAVVLAVPLAAWYAYDSFKTNQSSALERLNVKNGIANSTASQALASVPPKQRFEPVQSQTTAALLASYVPRIQGMPHTASRYDALTIPVSAPYPAGCIANAEKCTCYTMQATKINTPDLICRQMVANGYFNDFASAAQVRQEPTFPPSSSPN